MDQQQIIDALLTTLPPETIPDARAIARGIRRAAKDRRQPLPPTADIFSLLSAQKDPFRAFLEADDARIFSEMDNKERLKVMDACSLLRRDRGDVGILTQGWRAQKKPPTPDGSCQK